MCLSVPAKVLRVQGKAAEVEVYSQQRTVLLTEDAPVGVGDWVLVYGTVALRKIDAEEAAEILQLLESVTAV